MNELNISEIITVNTKKAMLKDNCYREPSLYKDYIEYTAGNLWTKANLISLSYGQFFKDLCKKNHESIESQTAKTLSHEVLHYVLLKEQNIQVCVALDNEDENGISFAEKLKDYGVY